MAETNQQDNNQNPTNHPPLSEPPIKGDGNQLESEQQESQNPDKVNRHGKRFKATWKSINKRKNQDRIANRIAFFALLIGAALAWWTYGVFDLTQKQSQSVIDAGEAAKEAARIAAETLNKDTLYNNKVYTQSRIDADSDNLRDNVRDSISKENLNIQNELLKQQIASLKEAKKQFERQNDPQFQIGGVKKLKIENGEINFRYQVFNNGNIPAQTISKSMMIMWSSKYIRKEDSIKIARQVEVYLNKNKTVGNIFIGGKENASYLKDGAQNPIYTSDFFNAFKRGDVRIHIFGRYEYISPVNNRRKNYDFEFEIIYDDPENVIYVLKTNKNYYAN